jgi:hypothetical protein
MPCKEWDGSWLSSLLASKATPTGPLPKRDLSDRWNADDIVRDVRV